jgi:hypothetical protein
MVNPGRQSSFAISEILCKVGRGKHFHSYITFFRNMRNTTLWSVCEFLWIHKIVNQAMMLNFTSPKNDFEARRKPQIQNSDIALQQAAPQVSASINSDWMMKQQTAEDDPLLHSHTRSSKRKKEVIVVVVVVVVGDKEPQSSSRPVKNGDM